MLAFSVSRHRHRHPAGQAADHLRGVPAGRRQHQPQVRRHRPGPGDQPRDRAAAGRRDPPGQRARQGQHVHALPAADLRAAEVAAQAGAGAAAPSRRGTTGAAPDGRRRPRRRRIAEPPTLVNEVGDDRDTIQPGRPAAADRRERPGVRPAPARGRPARRASRGWSPRSGAAALAMTRELQARRHHARHLPARHRRLARARAAQERPRPRGTSRSASSRPRRRASGPLSLRGAERRRPSRSRAARRSSSCSTTIQRLRRAAGSRTCSSSADDRRSRERDPRARSAATTFRVTVGRQRRRGARASSASERVDCLVLDLDLPDMTRRRRSSTASSASRRRPTLPVILYADRPPQRRRRPAPERLGPSLAFRQAGSPERLLDQTAFFLHSPVGKLPEAKRRMLEQLLPDRPGAGRQEGADRRRRHPQHLRADQRPGAAQHGRSSRPRRAATPSRSSRPQPDIDIVLMDIMMPEMDGIDTMRAIRKHPAVQDAADHRRDRQGHEGRPREVHRGRGLGLPLQAGGHRADAVRPARWLHR